MHLQACQRTLKLLLIRFVLCIYYYYCHWTEFTVKKKLGLILINIFNHYSFGLLLSWFCQSPQSLSLILMLYFNKTFYWNKYHAWYVDFSVKTTRNWIQFE